MSEHGGHLFIAHGRIESVAHDAALVPVGQEFRFAHYWDSLVGPRPSEPQDWDRLGWGRLDAEEPVWAVSVGGYPADPYSEILERVRSAISEAGSRRQETQIRRGEGALPLIAVPVIGIGRGGYTDDRGRVLRELIDLLATTATNENVDIVLVAPDPAVYAAAQYARRDHPTKLTPELEETARELGRRARRRELALLLGAGVSVPAGLPTWHKLIAELADHYDVPYAGTVDKLSLIDQAELIERASRRGDFAAVGQTVDFQRRVADRVKQVARPSLLHTLLASLDVGQVVTTNYDTLYEQAARATDREIKSVMPWSPAQGAKRWVLKLHGDVDHPEMIVLTRRHMVRFDAANRPSAAVLQSLLLTKKLLVVGASMTDDNVIRLAHEVQDYRSLHQPDGDDRFGTVIDVNGDRLRQQLWDGQLEWVSLVDSGRGTGYRTQELFLDRVATRASRDASWLLDERFAGLLEHDADREIAAQARRLHASLPDRQGDKWTRLRKELVAMGADSHSS